MTRSPLISIFAVLSWGLAAVASAGVNRWTTHGPSGADVVAIAVDPSNPAIVYAGVSSHGGVFKTTNGGESWNPINIGFPDPVPTVYDLAVDASSPSTLYAATILGVFKSTNGESWIAISTGLPRTEDISGTHTFVFALAVDPSTPATIYAGTDRGVSRTTNAGESWDSFNSGLPIATVESLAIDPAAPATLYAGTLLGVFKSIDAGRSWSPVNAGLPVFSDKSGSATHVNALALDRSTFGTVYAGTSHAGVFKTINGGGTWTAVNAGLGALRVESLVMDPSAPTTLYAAVFGGGIFKTTNAGGNWSPVFTGLTTPLVQALAVNPLAPATLYAGTYGAGGVFKSTDRGNNWKPVNGGLTNRAVRALAVDPGTADTLFAGGGGGIFKSIDGADSWVSPSAYFAYQDVTDVLVDPSRPATVFAAAVAYNSWGDESYAVFKSTDGGVNWKETPLPVWNLARDPSTPGTLYAGGFGVFRSRDRGETWTAFGVGLTDVFALAVDPSSPDTIYAGTYRTGAFRTTNGGGSWVPVGGGLSATIDVKSLLFDPENPSTLYAIAGDTGVFKSTDRGDRWRPINTGLPTTHGATSVTALAIDPATPSRLYVATENGVYKSIDGGATWIAMNSGLTGRYVNALSVDPVTHKIFAAADGVYEYLDRSCAPDSTTLCLGGGRFQVTTQWTTAAGQTGSGRAVALAGGDTGYFTFFGSENVEIAVKILNGCSAPNGNFWVFAGGLTNVGVTMTVTDTETGTVKSYTNPQGTPFRPIQDTAAFSTCAAGAPSGARPYAAATDPSMGRALVVEPSAAVAIAPCVADSTTLCLSHSRYKVRARVRWLDFEEWWGDFDAHALPLTGDTGAFWFFGANNIEVLIKVVDGCEVNSRHWVFAGGLTNAEVILTVTDTQTGVVRTYTNPSGAPFEPIQDTGAFTTCP